jgi:hypothetical protein
MLELDDPLWRKLDDAFYPELDIPRTLSELATAWDDEKANCLFWDHLCHQETCYGATYAVIPHLLRIAQPAERRRQRLEIALFLGLITYCAFTRQYPIGDRRTAQLEGLPQTLEEWDSKLDVYRKILASFKDGSRPSSNYEQTKLVPRCEAILKLDPIDLKDLEKIRMIRREFFQALPVIRSLCENALHENRDYEGAMLYLLGGVAAADGLHNLAKLLISGAEGQFRCLSCNWPYQYTLSTSRVAIYAVADETRYDERVLDDFKSGAPLRSNGFIVPIDTGSRVADGRAQTLLDLAERTSYAEPALLLRNFLGRFHCCQCGADGLVTAV